MARRSVCRLFVASFLSLGLALPLSAADWPMFRGPARDGVAAADVRPPLVWSADKNIKWKVDLPRPGNSSPVVVGDKVFLATALDADGRQRALLCLDRKDGKELWRKVVAFPQKELTHATNPYDAATPAADADAVVVWHGSAGLYCYDHAGVERWKLELGTIRHVWGWAGSPVVHGDTIFLNAGPGVRQFVCAVDKKTGKELWRTEEPGGGEAKYAGSWSTPRVVDVDGKPQLLVFMSEKVNAYDPATGKVLWTVAGAGPLAYADVYLTPPAADGSRTGMAMAGYGGAAIGFKIGGGEPMAGDVTATNRLWQNKDKHPQRIGTGVILGDRVIVPNEPYIGCYEVATGREVWREQVKGEKFWGSIVRAGDRLYVTSQKGTTYVFAADAAAFKLLATNPLGEPTNCTPAFSGGQAFLRTERHLWCAE